MHKITNFTFWNVLLTSGLFYIFITICMSHPRLLSMLESKLLGV